MLDFADGIGSKKPYRIYLEDLIAVRADNYVYVLDKYGMEWSIVHRTSWWLPSEQIELYLEME